MVDFGDVRSLLQQPPSHQSWAQLCAWVERSDDEELEQAVLPYVRQHLSRWPDRMRAAPRAWLDRMLQDSKKRVPAMALVSVLDLRSYAAARASWNKERDEDLSWILRRTELEYVRHILMHRVSPTVGELGALAANPAAAKVESIELGECELPANSDGRALLEVRELVGLREVAWTAAKLDDLFIQRLAEAPLGGQLERLDVSGNALTHVGVARLLSDARFARLRSLSAGKNPAQGRPLAALLSGSTAVSQLRELSLSQLDMRDTLAVLVRGPLAERLERLELWKAGLHSGAIEALAAAPLGALRALELSKNAVGDAGAQALAATTGLGALEELSLFDAGVGDAGARAIVEAAGTRLPKLWKINLLGNKLSPQTVGALGGLAEELGLSLKLPQL